MLFVLSRKSDPNKRNNYYIDKRLMRRLKVLLLLGRLLHLGQWRLGQWRWLKLLLLGLLLLRRQWRRLKLLLLRLWLW